MSGLFDSQPVVNIGTSATLIYAPTTDGVGMSCIVANAHYAALPVTAWIDRAGTIMYLIQGGVRINAGDSLDILKGSKVAFKAGDKLYASCPVANVMTGILSAYKDQ